MSSEFVSTTVPTVAYPSPASVGLKHAHGERCRPAAVGELEHAHDLAEELLGVEARDEVGRDPPDVRARELPDAGRRFAARVRRSARAAPARAGLVPADSL